jgi:hypothetical protein
MAQFAVVVEAALNSHAVAWNWVQSNAKDTRIPLSFCSRHNNLDAFEYDCLGLRSLNYFHGPPML